MIQRYLVAKYAPDLMRMEPRNIGVILWANGDATARFLPSDETDFIDDKELYDRWINFWNRLIEEKCISNGRRIALDDPAFLDAMLKTQKGNFLLFDSGRVYDEIKPSDLSAAADFLFGELVAIVSETPATATIASERLCAASDRLMSKTRLKDRSDWQGAATVTANVKGTPQRFPFHYVIGTADRPKALFHRVPVARAQSVTSASFMMEYASVQQSRRAALIDRSTPGDAVSSNVALLRLFATVIDVNDPDAADQLIQAAG